MAFAGILDAVVDLQQTRGLIPATDQVFKLGSPRQGRCFHSCPLVGKSVHEGRFRIAIQAAEAMDCALEPFVATLMIAASASSEAVTD